MLSLWNFFDPEKYHIHGQERLTHFKVTPDACGNSVFRTSARVLVPVNDMNPMAIADSGASHVILPQTALFDSKVRLAAGEINAVEAHREIFAEHVTIPLCPLGRVIQKLQLTAVWTPQTLTLNYVSANQEQLKA